MKTWTTNAPSNIALIKYMGKKNTTSNWPDNASLSYTLNKLLTTVSLTCYEGDCDRWEPLVLSEELDATLTQQNSFNGKNCERELPPFELSEQAQNRFLVHLARLKQYFQYQGNFIVRSNNNFPHSSGLASSASSFAALTKVTCMALSELCQQPRLSINEQAQLSRQGSGSSCRSFYSPWALWEDESVKPVTLPYQTLIHQVVVIDKKVKAVSSSEAHRRVTTSPSYIGRPQRATQRLQALLRALCIEDWKCSADICREEFLDMHQLFETCSSPFRYITQASQKALEMIDDIWKNEKDGPLVTMDAGPNIHLLYRPEQHLLAERIKNSYLSGQFNVL